MKAGTEPGFFRWRQCCRGDLDYLLRDSAAAICCDI